MDLIGAQSLPYMTRRNYRYEFLHLLPWGVLAGLVEGNACAVIVTKTFGAGPWLMTAATATPIGSLLFASVWGMLAAGRPKLRLATLFGSGVALSLATVAMVPLSEWGGILFVAQMACAQIFMAGVVTIRSAMWRHNYPGDVRGTIAARLQALRMVMGLATITTVSLLFDHDPGLYRFVYPAAAVSGLVAMVILQRIQIRRERADLRHVKSVSAGAGETDSDTGRRYKLGMLISPRSVFSELYGVLRQDRRYARYLGAQMLLGTGVQMIAPALVLILDEHVAGYLATFLLADVIANVFMFASIRRWGSYLDRVGVTRMRIFTGACASIGLLCGMTAAMLVVRSPGFVNVAIGLLAVRAIFHGLHRGGGTLAWNLGHLHFATRENAELYMGVHQTLTGLRGMTAPFLGTLLWSLTGWGVWGVACVLCVASSVWYYRLWREESPDHRPV